MATSSSTTERDDSGARARESEATTHEGWSNYETWAVALWLDNDQGSYEYVREMAVWAWENATDSAVFTRGQAAAAAMAARLKDEHDEGASFALGDEPASVFSDLLGSALDRVDWHELGHHYVTDWLFETMGAV